MGLHALIARVEHAEAAMQACVQHGDAQRQRLRASWRAAWTPGRIVVCGLAAGFLVGRSRPLQLAGSAGVLKLFGSMSSLLSSELAKALASRFMSAAPDADVADKATPGEPPTA